MSEANKPAFPVAEDHKIAADFDWTAGLTKREYFSTKMMQAILPEMLRRVDAYGKQGEVLDADGINESLRLSQIATDGLLAETERQNDMLALVERVAKLNKEYGEISPAMLNKIVDEARFIIGWDE